MASLWALYAKNKLMRYPSVDVSTCDLLCKTIDQSKPVLVNVQGIMDAFEKEDSPVGIMDVSQDITPCHKHLWFEWINSKQNRAAIDISRVMASEYPGATEKSRFCVRFVPIMEINGRAMLMGWASLCIDDLGIPILETFQSAGEGENLFEYQIGMMIHACEALTTMNTRGTRIEPPLDKPPCQVVKPNRAPCSVWHTIHLPKFASEPLNAETSGEVLERREHWVRAHRADYRNGKGLFGRVKALVWIPEHKRGNAELGTVKQRFEVNAK